jgi:hypothetical protein
MRIPVMRENRYPVSVCKKSIQPSLNIVIILLSIMPSELRSFKTKIIQVTYVNSVSKTSHGVIIHSVTTSFLIVTHTHVKVTKNKPVRIIINLREITNKPASLKLFGLIRVAINVSSPPVNIVIIDKKINVVRIMTNNIQLKITIIP